MINGCRKTQVLTLSVSTQKGPRSIFWFTDLPNLWLHADLEYMKIPTHRSAVRTCVLRVRQVKHLVSVSNACRLRGEDIVSDLRGVSGSNNVKLQTFASKSLSMKKRAMAGKERPNHTWNRSWVVSCQNKIWHNPAISTVNLIMGHLQTEHLYFASCILVQNGAAPVLSIEEQKTTRESFASDFKHSPNQALLGRSFPHSSSGLSMLSWVKPRCRLCECQNTWTMVETRRVMIRKECKARFEFYLFKQVLGPGKLILGWVPAFPAI